MLDVLTTANPIVQAVAGGATYGYTFYLRHRWDGDDTTEFDLDKFGTTIFLAAIIGAFLWAVGIEPTFASVGWMLTTFAGTVALTEAALKALLRGERQHAKMLGTEAIREAIHSLLSLGTDKDQVRDSINEGTDNYENMSDDERSDEWDGAYPDEMTMLSVDDSDDGYATAETGTETEELAIISPEGEKDDGGKDLPPG